MGMTVSYGSVHGALHMDLGGDVLQTTTPLVCYLHRMPITIDLANLVITKAAVTNKYPGGMAAFRADFRFDPIARADQEDNELLRIGAMELEALWSRMLRLREAGLTYSEDDPAQNDMVLIARYGGPVNMPDWLRTNSLYAWHASCDPEKQTFVRSVVKLDMDEFLARQQRGEIPVGPVV